MKKIGLKNRESSYSVLYLDNTLTFGGAINSLKYLTWALSQTKFEPIVVSGQPLTLLNDNFGCTSYSVRPNLHWEKSRWFRALSGLPVFKCLYLRKMLNFSRLIFWNLFIGIPEAFRFWSLGRKHDVNLVHLNNLPSSQFSGILAAKLLRVPCVAHLRDFELVHPVSRFYSLFIDHFVAISEAIRENLHDLGVRDNRITVVHDALDLEIFTPALNSSHIRKDLGLSAMQLVFGIFGRVAEWKGIREFLYAAQKVINEVPSAVGVVVGDASEQDADYFAAMKRLSVELGIEKKITFTGYRNDVASVMREVDIIVHSSITPEPFGMVIVEGMAMKKPVVATRGGGAIDIVVDGETGLLVDIGSSDALARAIISLLRQPLLRSRMGEAGRLRVEKMFNNSQCAAQVSSIYNALLE